MLCTPPGPAAGGGLYGEQASEFSTHARCMGTRRRRMGCGRARVRARPRVCVYVSVPHSLFPCPLVAPLTTLPDPTACCHPTHRLVPFALCAGPRRASRTAQLRCGQTSIVHGPTSIPRFNDPRCCLCWLRSTCRPPSRGRLRCRRRVSSYCTVLRRRPLRSPSSPPVPSAPPAVASRPRACHALARPRLPPATASPPHSIRTAPARHAHRPHHHQLSQRLRVTRTVPLELFQSPRMP